MKKPKFSEFCQTCESFNLDSVGCMIYICPECQNFDTYEQRRKKLNEKIRDSNNQRGIAVAVTPRISATASQTQK